MHLVGNLQTMLQMQESHTCDQLICRCRLVYLFRVYVPYKETLDKLTNLSPVFNSKKNWTVERAGGTRHLFLQFFTFFFKKMECYLRMDGALLPKTELIGVQVLFLNKVYTPGGGCHKGGHAFRIFCAYSNFFAGFTCIFWPIFAGFL